MTHTSLRWFTNHTKVPPCQPDRVVQYDNENRKWWKMRTRGAYVVFSLTNPQRAVGASASRIMIHDAFFTRELFHQSIRHDLRGSQHRNKSAQTQGCARSRSDILPDSNVRANYKRLSTVFSRLEIGRLCTVGTLLQSLNFIWHRYNVSSTTQCNFTVVLLALLLRKAHLVF